MYWHHFNNLKLILVSRQFSLWQIVECWVAFRCNLLPQTYTVQSNQRATHAIFRHAYLTIYQQQFGHITYISHISAKYLLLQIFPPLFLRHYDYEIIFMTLLNEKLTILFFVSNRREF
jgi:hypothetical protein